MCLVLGSVTQRWMNVTPTKRFRCSGEGRRVTHGGTDAALKP